MAEKYTEDEWDENRKLMGILFVCHIWKADMPEKEKYISSDL